MMHIDTKRELLTYLQTFISENKKSKFETNIENRTRFLTIVLEDIYQSHNASAVLRTCDCFGVQDINIIENRYNKQIEELKQNEEQEEFAEVSSKLGRLFFELAILNRERRSIKKFFLRESYQYFSDIRSNRKLLAEELNTLIRILLELKLYMNAADIIEREKSEESVEYLFLKAEIWFAMGNYTETRDICRRIQDFPEALTDKEQMTIDYWLGM